MDSIQKELISPMAGLLPVPASTHSESKSRGMGFFDTLIAELDKAKKQPQHKAPELEKNTRRLKVTNEPLESDHRHQEAKPKGEDHSDEVAIEAEPTKDPMLINGVDEKNVNNTSPASKEADQAEEFHRLQANESGESNLKESDSASKIAPEENSLNAPQRPLEASFKVELQPIKEDSNAPGSALLEQDLETQISKAPLTVAQEVDFGFTQVEEKSRQNPNSEKVFALQEDSFLKDLAQADEVFNISDEEFFTAAKILDETGALGLDEELKIPQYDDQSLAEETQAFIEFILDQAEDSSSISQPQMALEKADSAELNPSNHQDELDMDPEILLHQILELIEDPQSLKETPIQEEMRRLIEVIKAQSANMGMAQSGPLGYSQKFTDFVQNLENLLTEPTNEKALQFSKEMDREVYEELKKSFNKIFQGDGKISLGEDFQALRAKLEEKKELKRLGHEFLVEKNTLEQVEEKSTSNPKRPMETTLNSKLFNDSVGGAFKEMPAALTAERLQITESNTSAMSLDGEEHSPKGEGDSASSNKRESHHGLMRILDLKPDSEEKASSLKFNFNLSRELNPEVDLKKDQTASLENRLASLAKSELSADGFRFKTASERLERSVMNQVILKVRALRPPRVNVLRISLNPGNLGNVKVELKNAKDGLKIHFQAETQAVKEIIDRNLGQLRESFKAQGLEVNKLEVEVRDQSQQESGRGKESQGKQNKNRKNKNESMTSPEAKEISEIAGENRINEYA